jgi:hypothetical protein
VTYLARRASDDSSLDDGDGDGDDDDDDDAGHEVEMMVATHLGATRMPCMELAVAMSR